MKKQSKRVVIRWAGETFRVPVDATHYELYARRTAARRNMYRLERAVCEQLGAPAWDIEQAKKTGGKDHEPHTSL